MQITERAMLARLNVSAWTARRHDRKVSEEVAEKHHTKVSVGRYNKMLVDPASLVDIEQAKNAARGFYYQNTLPWMDDGYRILPSTNYLAFTEKMHMYRARYEDEVRDFVSRYPALIDKAREDLNGLFCQGDYPSPSRIADKFGFAVEAMPIPDASDFRVALGDEEEARIRQSIEERVTAAVEGAQRDLWQRIHDVTSRVSERLGAYRIVNGKVEGKFHDSLVENVRDLVGLLPRLNLKADPQIDRVARDLDERLCRHDAQELRDSPHVRRDVKAAADEILKAMEGYCS